MSQTEKAVLWLDKQHVGNPLRWVLYGVLNILPIAQAFDFIKSPWWLAVFIPCLAIARPLDLYREGAARRRFMRSIGKINGSFAGNLDLFSGMLGEFAGPLGEEGSKLLCIGLLHRIRDFSAWACDIGEGTRLRATLAVPLRHIMTREVYALKVWCYDETHPDCQYSEIPLRGGNGRVLPGAPEAFMAGGGQSSIIDDIRHVTAVSDGHVRSYRSILSIGLPQVDTNGLPLAVVSLDCNQPAFFRPADVLDKIVPVVSPVINAIGLVLLHRQADQPYEFPREKSRR